MPILFALQAPNGAIVGGIGDTTDEALQALSDTLGDDALLVWSEAMGQLTDQLAGQVDRVGHSLSALNRDSDAGSGDEGGAARERTSKPALETEASRADGGRVEQEGDRGERSTAEEDAPASSKDAEGSGSPRCEICDTPVKPARAELSMERVGAVRCKQCMAA